MPRNSQAEALRHILESLVPEARLEVVLVPDDFTPADEEYVVFMRDIRVDHAPTGVHEDVWERVILTLRDGFADLALVGFGLTTDRRHGDGTAVFNRYAQVRRTSESPVI